MRQAKRLAVAIIGFTVMLLGVLMLVIPGPGWLAILLGLGILTAEFMRARRVLRQLSANSAGLMRSVSGKRDTSGSCDRRVGLSHSNN